MAGKKTKSDKAAEIYRSALAVFMTYGIKSVTMDDVARRLGMSKKTLYNYVKNKGELVTRCVESDCCAMRDRLSEVQGQGMNAIDENVAFSGVVVEELRDIHPSIFYDLEKYYPEAFGVLDEMRFSFITDLVEANLKKGIAEGLYRRDIDIAIMTRLWVLRLNLIFAPLSFPANEYDLTEVYREMVIHHLRGIANAKGLTYLDKHDLDFCGNKPIKAGSGQNKPSKQ